MWYQNVINVSDTPESSRSWDPCLSFQMMTGCRIFSNKAPSELYFEEYFAIFEPMRIHRPSQCSSANLSNSWTSFFIFCINVIIDTHWKALERSSNVFTRNLSVSHYVFDRRLILLITWRIALLCIRLRIIGLVQKALLSAQYISSFRPIAHESQMPLISLSS